jgi:methionyl-tRNA synthetase
MINNENISGDSRLRGNDRLSWDDFGRTDLLPAGHALGEVGLLFEKIEDEAIEAQIQKLEDTKKNNEIAGQASNDAAAVKETVAFEDWEKLDIRVGTVLECAKVPKADKLLQFKIADGNGERTILSGIAAYYPEPEKLVGSQVCFIANFAPRKLRGIDSEGMILSAQLPDGKLIMIQPKDKIENGSCVC